MLRVGKGVTGQPDGVDAELLEVGELGGDPAESSALGTIRRSEALGGDPGLGLG